ncbi:MAG: tRNA threonylcarbamoyladenosine dehydratase [Clostridia bacterium]|nr:tRNA threonylcarbamoyladenosine dehydratase [Clostridia bacterium]
MSELFSREELLLGSNAVKKLNNSAVILFGVGGVGSYAAEALARAGVGKIALVDSDTVNKSNINRQLLALHSTLGRYKVDVMKERILDINPDAEVCAYNQFYLESNCDFIDFGDYDFIIDAIDTVSAKLHIICRAEQLGVPVISCMGTGNRIDPTKFGITDIFKTEGCPLARVMRTELRKRGIKKLPVVFSAEEAKRHSSVSKDNRTIGSISFVPSCAGLIAAGYVIRKLTEDIK